MTERPQDPASDAPAARGVRLDALVRWLRRFRGPVAAIAGVGAVLGGFAGYWNAYHAARIGLQDLPASVAISVAPALSIVVLPFANLTGDAQQEYVADGLTASLTADLARIRDAFIVSSTTAFAYKGRAVAAQQVGRELGVRFVLQGNVQRSGGRLRVNAQLADASTNAQLWSESFDGDPSDLFALQDRVTTRISNSIGPAMVVVAARESESRRSDPKVADLILRARAISIKSHLSLHDYQQIEALSRQALALEPANAMAMVYLASSLALQASNFGDTMPAAERESKSVEGRDFALKAKDIDPANPGVYTALATYAGDHDDYLGSLQAAQAQLAVDARNPIAYNNLAVTYYYFGDARKALDLLTQAIDLNPRRPSSAILFNLGRAQLMLGDDGAALDWLRKAAQADPSDLPSYAYIAAATARNGDDANAHAAVSELLRVHPKFRFAQWEAPTPGSPPAYRDYYDTRLLPAMRKAGVPV